jgi:hypothetical protein
LYASDGSIGSKTPKTEVKEGSRLQQTEQWGMYKEIRERDRNFSTGILRPW